MTFEPGKALVDWVVTVVQTFDAPRKVVFEAWIDPYHVAKWWGPRGFTAPRFEWDARPGGAIRIDMQGPDGVIHPMRGEIREIVSPEKFIFASIVDDADGNVIFEVLNTVTFDEHARKTTVSVDARITKARPQAAAMAEGIERHWTESLDRLQDLLPGQ